MADIIPRQTLSQNALSPNCTPKGLFIFHKNSLLSPRRYTEKAMAPHSSTLAWKIPWTEEPGRLQSMGSQRVGHDGSNLAAAGDIHPTPLSLLKWYLILNRKVTSFNYSFSWLSSEICAC